MLTGAACGLTIARAQARLIGGDVTLAPGDGRGTVATLLIRAPGPNPRGAVAAP